jgi:hypothetical protein
LAGLRGRLCGFNTGFRAGFELTRSFKGGLTRCREWYRALKPSWTTLTYVFEGYVFEAYVFEVYVSEVYVSELWV